MRNDQQLRSDLSNKIDWKLLSRSMISPCGYHLMCCILPWENGLIRNTLLNNVIHWQRQMFVAQTVRWCKCVKYSVAVLMLFQCNMQYTVYLLPKKKKKKDGYHRHVVLCVWKKRENISCFPCKYRCCLLIVLKYKYGPVLLWQL